MTGRQAGRQTVGRQGDHTRVTMLELYLALKLMPVQCACVCVCVCVAACARVNWLGKKLLPLGHIAQVATGNWPLSRHALGGRYSSSSPLPDACRHPRCILCGVQESWEGVEELRVGEVTEDWKQLGHQSWQLSA